LVYPENANFSTLNTTRSIYYQNTINPLLKNLTQSLTKGLLNPNGISGQDLFLDFVDKSPEDHAAKLAENTLLVNASSLTFNELRYRNGLPEIEGGDVLVSSLQPKSEQI
jgi:hypothetical protein